MHHSVQHIYNSQRSLNVPSNSTPVAVNNSLMCIMLVSGVPPGKACLCKGKTNQKLRVPQQEFLRYLILELEPWSFFQSFYFGPRHWNTPVQGQRKGNSCRPTFTADGPRVRNAFNARSLLWLRKSKCICVWCLTVLEEGRRKWKGGSMKGNVIIQQVVRACVVVNTSCTSCWHWQGHFFLTCFFFVAV